MMRTGRTMALATLAAASLAATHAGCGPKNTDSGTCTFTVDWGRFEGEVFVPFADGENAEITVGFQGFRFIYSGARLSGVSAPQASFNFDVAVETFTPYFLNAGTADLTPGAGGDRFADNVLVFFNDIPTPELVGKTAHIVAYAAAGGCTGRDEVDVVLVDENACIAPPDAGNMCPDAGI